MYQSRRSTQKVVYQEDTVRDLQIHIVELEFLQACIYGSGDVRDIRDHLGCHKKLLPWDTTLFDGKS
jgi:hypothetical protein